MGPFTSGTGHYLSNEKERRMNVKESEFGFSTVLFCLPRVISTVKRCDHG